MKRNLSTPEGRRIWEAVESAAASAPKWAADYLMEQIKKRAKTSEKLNS